MTTPPASTPRSMDYVRLDEVRPAERNPRAHDLPAIMAGILEFGFFDGVIRDERTGRLIAGHGRIEALVELRRLGADLPDGLMLDEDGMWLLPVQAGWASKSDIAATAALVGHNRSNENARWDDYGLAEMLEEIATEAPDLLDAAAVDEEFMEDLLAHVNPERLGEQDPDAPVPAPIDKGEPDPSEVIDDGSQAAVKDETESDEDVAEANRNIICPSCGHRFPAHV